MTDDMSPAAKRMQQGLKAFGWLPLEEGEQLPFRRLVSKLHPVNDESGEYAGNEIVGFFEGNPDQKVAIFVPALSEPDEAEDAEAGNRAGRIPPQEAIEAAIQRYSVPLGVWGEQ